MSFKHPIDENKVGWNLAQRSIYYMIMEVPSKFIKAKKAYVLFSQKSRSHLYSVY